MDIEKFQYKDNYRRITNKAFFDTYFKINLNKETITKKEKQILLDSLDNNSFKESFINQYNANKNKALDFLIGWRSNHNNEALICGLLSLDNQEMINCLCYSIDYYRFIFNLIKHNSLSPAEVYNIIKNTKEYIKTNCFAYMFLLCCLYKFPLENPPKTSDPYIDKSIDIIKENISYEAIIKSQESARCIEYLGYLEVDCSQYIDKLISKGEEYNLLHFLLTTEKTLEEYEYAFKIFNLYNKEDLLQKKLINIAKENKELMKKEEFFIEYTPDHKEHIVNCVLSILANRLILSLSTDKNIDETMEIITKLFDMKEFLNKTQNNMFNKRLEELIAANPELKINILNKS